MARSTAAQAMPITQKGNCIEERRGFSSFSFSVYFFWICFSFWGVLSSAHVHSRVLSRRLIHLPSSVFRAILRHPIPGLVPLPLCPPLGSSPLPIFFPPCLSNDDHEGGSSSVRPEPGTEPSDGSHWISGPIRLSPIERERDRRATLSRVHQPCEC